MSFHTQFPSNLKANTRGRCRSLRPRVVIYGTSDHWTCNCWACWQPHRPWRQDASRPATPPHLHPHLILLWTGFHQGFSRLSGCARTIQVMAGPDRHPRRAVRPALRFISHIYGTLAALLNWINPTQNRPEETVFVLPQTPFRYDQPVPHSPWGVFHFLNCAKRNSQFQIPTGILRYSNIFNTWRLSQGNLDFTRSGFPWKHTAHNAVTGKCSEMHVPASKYMNHKMQLISTSI